MRNYVPFELNPAKCLYFLMSATIEKLRCSTLNCGRQLVNYSNFNSLNKHKYNTHKIMHYITGIGLTSRFFQVYHAYHTVYHKNSGTLPLSCVYTMLYAQGRSRLHLPCAKTLSPRVFALVTLVHSYIAITPPLWPKLRLCLHISIRSSHLSFQVIETYKMK